MRLDVKEFRAYTKVGQPGSSISLSYKVGLLQGNIFNFNFNFILFYFYLVWRREYCVGSGSCLGPL
jgi:hypothetical protein